MDSYTSTHLTGGEVVRRSGSSSHDALTVAPLNGIASVGLVLPHTIPLAERVAFLRRLAAAAENLADELAFADIADGAA